MYPKETLLSKYVIKTHYIVRVMAVHPETQTVDVIQDSYELTLDANGDMMVLNVFGTEIPAGVAEPFVVMGVPVKQERWGQFEIQCCPEVGDTGYIEVFTDNIRKWVKEGIAAVPTTAEKFDVDSCVFVPFIPSKESASKDYPENNTKLVIKSNNVRVEIVDDEESKKKEINITSGNVNITSDINITGNVNMEGDLSIEGNISSSGELKAEGKISAKGEISSEKDVVAGGVSLKNHTHNFNYVGAGTGSSPQVGTTQGAN